jgi:putative membrane protein
LLPLSPVGPPFRPEAPTFWACTHKSGFASSSSLDGLLVLLALIGVVAIVVWIVQWANDHRRFRTALDILDERFARGEIDRAEYEEKRKLIGSR